MDDFAAVFRASRAADSGRRRVIQRGAEIIRRARLLFIEENPRGDHDGGWLRRRPDEELDEEAAAAIEDLSDNPATALEKKDKSAMLRKCLAGLSAEHREIMDLVYYHEKSVEEVAEIVGIPENTVKTRMFYARKRLAELLKSEGIERG
jgi:RNA polymerase sigma factor (sigma-70 family)